MTVLSCGEEKKGYTLNGEISDVKDGMVYLKKYQDKSFHPDIPAAADTPLASACGFCRGKSLHDGQLP